MNTAQLKEHVLRRIGEDTSSPVYYSGTETLAALNASQRLFCLFTLCLEKTANFPLTTNQNFYTVLDVFPDYIAPLRVRFGTAKVKPSRLTDLDALNPAWQAEQGNPERYVSLGFDMLAFYKRLMIPPETSASVSMTYAKSPAVLVEDADVPEVPEEYHPSLVDGAIPLLRSKEGAQEFSKVQDVWTRFLKAAQKMAAYVRARSLAQQYDTLPFELKRYDKSKEPKEWTSAE